ncbi:histidine kinase [Nonomuraea sp. B19D2]|uniref:sensor histidine kinase n=1 Tax=Nonomuraea sp. B19D2 TaxID=3159561 RepID=UPI0032D9F23E
MTNGLRLIDRHAPWLLGVAVFALSMMSVLGQVGVASTLAAPVLMPVALAAGAAAALARRWFWPLAVVGAVAYVWLMMWPALFAASYYAGARGRPRRFLALAVLACAGATGVSAAAGGYRALVGGTLPNALMWAALVVALPLLAGLWVRAKRERVEQLEREQVMRAEQARTQERARIAREMHDVVAHRVSLIVLHAGALELRTDDEGTAETATLIGDIGREALADLRDVLGILRTRDAQDAGTEALSPQPTLADLDRLLDQTRSLGTPVTRHDEGEARPVGETVERTAYRVVQEALTNVHKHAGRAPAEVFIRYLPAKVEVEVRNDRPADGGEALPGSGWGLLGLRERVELAGGSLDAAPVPGAGFRVLARIPSA